MTNKPKDEIDELLSKYVSAYNLDELGFRESGQSKLHKALDHHYAKLMLEARLEGAIKALSHVLSHGATGRKHIGLNRSYVVSYLAEKQQDRKDLWELRGQPKATKNKLGGEDEST